MKGADWWHRDLSPGAAAKRPGVALVFAREVKLMRGVLWIPIGFLEAPTENTAWAGSRASKS